MTTSVLGIDAGVQRTGWGVVVREGPRLVARGWGVVRSRDDDPLERRLLAIHDGLVEVLALHAPTSAAIEDVFHGRHARAALVLGHARGAALLALARSGIPVAAYPPALVKKAIAGRGGADKKQMQHLVRAILSLRELPPTDAADALAVAICHANALGVTDRWQRPRE